MYTGLIRRIRIIRILINKKNDFSLKRYFFTFKFKKMLLTKILSFHKQFGVEDIRKCKFFY